MKLRDMSRIWATQDLPPLKQKLYGKKSILLCAGIVSVLGGQLFLFWLEVFSFFAFSCLFHFTSFIIFPHKHFTAYEKRIPCYSLYGLLESNTDVPKLISEMLRSLCNQLNRVFFCAKKVIENRNVGQRSDYN